MGAVQRLFRLQVEEKTQRSLQAALLVRTGWDRQERICQNGRALPAKLEVPPTLFLASGNASSLPIQVQEMSPTFFTKVAALGYLTSCSLC